MISTLLRTISLILGLGIFYIGMMTDNYQSDHWFTQLRTIVGGSIFILYGIGGNSMLKEIPFLKSLVKNSDTDKDNR